MSTAHAGTPTSPDDDPAQWDSIGEDDSNGPWLYDPDGNAIRLPAACIGFQVRFWPHNARGIGELVLNEEDGLPLFLPRNGSPEQFREAVDYRVGRYRLFLLDAARRRMAHVPAQVTITKVMAARQRERLAAETIAEPPPPQLVASPPVTADLLTQALLQAHLRLLDIVDRGQAQALGSVTELVRAAGDAGVVAKTAAIAAASAGAPIVFAPPATNAAAGAPPASAGSNPTAAAAATESPRNGAPASSSHATEPAKPTESEETTPLEIAMRVLEPIFGPAAKVAAARLGKTIGLSMEEVASVLGTPTPAASDAAADAWTQATSKDTESTASTDTHTSSDPASASAQPPPPPASASVDPGQSGAALTAHFESIRSQLSADETRTLVTLALRHHDRMSELKALVGRMSVERAVVVTRKFLAVWQALTTPEQEFVGSLIANPRAGFAGVLSLVEQRTLPNALTVIRNTMERARAA